MSRDPKTTDPEVREGPPIEELMANEDEFVELDTAAWDEQESGIDGEDPRPQSPRDVAADEAAGAPRAEARAPGRIDRALQILLACNLALIAVMLAMPGSGERAPAAEPARELKIDDAPRPDPFATAPRKIGALPADQLWEAAVRRAGEGEYGEAAELLERYLATAKSLTDVERRLIYNQLAFYLVKDGRLEEAQSYERKSNQIMTRSYLPEDLLRSAHHASEQGQMDDMRASYARFLLQQKQIPPSLRKFVAEAYLKLGDSYRLEAEQGRAREQEQDRARAMREAQETHK